MENIFKEKGFEAQLDKPQKMMVVKQIGFIGTEDQKRYWLKIRDVILQHGVDKLLIDGSESKLLPLDAQKWFESEYFPSVAKMYAGRKLKIARVESEDVFSQVSGHKID
ncbi:MAG: hypothetical protein K2Q22_05095, partial [Cytophagales bacterium]|nr:hypothetical protein [Cytophagales bacterium]